MRAPLLFVLLVVAALVAAAQAPMHYGLQPESRFWIDGTSTAGRFTCAAAQVEGEGAMAGDERRQLSGRVRVPVRAFDCGQRRMNADFADALKATAHPAIRFEVQQARFVGPASDGWQKAQATGTVEIAGQRRPLTVEVDGRRMADGRVRVRGRFPTRMTDYGVRPPTGLLGLVRAHDRVVVRFDLIAVAEN